MSGADPATLSNVIGLIYDCALDPRAWPVALEEIRQFREASVMGIEILDSVKQEIRSFLNVGLSAQAEKELAETYAALMPKSFYDSSNLVVGELYTVDDVMDYGDFSSSRFFLEWAKPNNLIDTATSCIMKTSTRFGMATCMLPRVSTARDRDLGLLLTPHIRRAATISDLLDSRLVEIGYLEKALNALSIGVAITDEQAKVLFANRIAEAMFVTGDSIRVKSGILSTRSEPVTNTLWKTIRQAAREEASLGVTGIGVPAPNSDGDGGLLLHVLPLERRSGGKLLGARQVAIFMADNDRPAFVPMDILAAVYGLTPTEAQVLMRVGEGEMCDEIARSMNVASSTVRTHLNRLLTKTGKRRQAELVKLVGQFSLPIRGE
jgi:DNA-binding CsgD family transcriptional regulator/PAS domain-containing protein